MVPTTDGWSVVRSRWSGGSATGAETSKGENRAAGLRTRESTDELVARVGDSALVEFVELDGSLHAVSVASGQVRLHALGEIDPLREVLARVPFALRRLAMSRARTAGVEAASAMLQGAATTFDDLLLRPLAAQLRDRPLVLVPTGALQSIPWSVLPSCLGRPVTVSPSAALWSRAASRPGPEQGAEVVVVAGPGLPGALTEAASIAKMYADSVLLAGNDAIVVLSHGPHGQCSDAPPRGAWSGPV